MLEILLILAAAVSSLWNLSRRLPLQNIAALIFLIILASGGIEALAAKTGFPFRSVLFVSDHHKILGLVSWPLPLLWIALLLNLRQLGKIVLKKRRRSKYYGFELMAWTALTTSIAYEILESFSSRKLVWPNLPGLFFSAIAILFLIAPWLIEKKPVSSVPDDQIVL